MAIAVALLAFVVGVLLAIWATERLLEGLIGLALLLRISAFATGAVFSGLEAENIAVGLSSGQARASAIALGTVFGGAIFLVGVALGLGAILFPLRIALPRSFLVIFALAPVVAGVALVAPVTPRWAGAVLLVAFALAMVHLVRTHTAGEQRIALRSGSTAELRTHTAGEQRYLSSDEVEEALRKRRPVRTVIGLTLVGLVVITAGGELVARGAQGLIASLGVPSLVMGMVVTPAAIELEEVFRQAIPSRAGRHDVSAGNLIGTMLYFVLGNLGLIVLITPVQVDPSVRLLDWPFLVGMTWIATILLWRGRIGRLGGAFLLGCWALYVALRVLAG